MQVASYFASLGFKVDKRELRQVDSHLKKIEAKLKKFTNSKLLKIKFSLDKFDVDQKKLNLVLGNALDAASPKVAFEVSRFVVNDRNLLAALLRAARRLPPLPPGPNPPPGPVPPTPNPPGPDSSRRRLLSAGVAGGIGGLAARLYTPALTLGLGGYGLGALNRRNQEVVAAQLQTQAVTQAHGGTAAQGSESFDWLRAQADRVGFNYLKAAPDFNILMSNMLGAGSTIEESQNVFKGFAEYGRVNKLSAARQNLVFNALGQIAGKNALQAEELTKQLGNSLPGAKSLFAEAWQKKTGGNLTGQEAIAALEDAMEKGLVKGDILNYAANIASERSQSGLAAASKASQAEQDRFQNALNDQAVNASNSGVESGFARLFRSLAISMKEATPVVQSMAKAFDEISKGVSKFILLPQSIKRAFEGRDSWFGDTYGPETVKNLKSFLEGMGEIFDELKKIAATATEGWGMLLPSLVSIANKIKDIFLYTLKMFNALLPGGEGVDAAANYGRAMQASLAGKSPEEVAAIAAGKDFVPDVKNPIETAFNLATAYDNLPAASGLVEYLAKWNEQNRIKDEYRLAREAGIKNRSSIYYNDPKGFDQMVVDRMKAASFDSQYYAQKASVNSTVTIASGAIVINTAVTDAEGIAKELQPHLKKMLDTDHTERVGAALLMYSQKE